ncbi:flagellar basal body P-ring formation chaperone FlgA [Termitidicoccus mucosus]|uniref:Flagella basal body P-ring formation protein FlgA n=1 Tax=Termitidicoccus mucosus TaxID=1184151 RepID=A0A178IF55_9BACT|nr:hypothetical protein AW736_16395 [Opitutaceae bacterium TSB47]
MRRLLIILLPVVLPALFLLRAEQATAGADLLARMQAELTVHLEVEGELILEWAGQPPRAMDAATGVKVLEYPSALAPQMLVRVRMEFAQGVVRDQTLAVRAQQWCDGLVTREPAERGSGVQRAALDRRRFNALRERDVVLAGVDADLVYARAVPSGRLLTWRDVAKRPLVRRGETAEISAGEGPFQVVLRGICMEDGGKGDIVRFRNPVSKKEFNARVVAESRAEVRF